MESVLGACNSYLEVDLGAIARNCQKVREHIGSDVDIIPVLKGNAYAAGLQELGRFMTLECGAKTVACAQAWEAEHMRQAGVDCEILVMGGVPFNNIPTVVELGLMTPAYHEDYLTRLNAEAAARGKKAKVHIKIETGLNRIGVHPGEELDTLCMLLKTLPALEVVGIYTHFAESENPDRSFTLLQMARFREALKQVEPFGFDFTYVHAFNTSSIVWMRDPCITHIRAAGIFFGFDTCLEPVNGLGLEESLTWRAFITHVKTIEAGEALGYGRSFTAEAPMKIATVSAGYGDGYSRALAAYQGAELLVHGQRCKILATCMDQTFLDVTHLENVKLNDTVTLIGRDGDACISVFELQEKMGQTYLATVATIQNRVKRVYKR